MRRFALLASFCLYSCANQPQFPYQDPKRGVDVRTEDLLRRMTPEEKADISHANAKLGIPALMLGTRASGIDLEATWNPELVSRLAAAEAADEPVFDAKGGDPWLTSRMAVAWVSGVQSEGGIAVMRDLRCGADERTMNEQYLPPFRAAIEESGLWAIDTGKCAGDDALLNGVIKRDWGFRGFFVPSPGDDPDDHARRVLRALFAAGAFDGEKIKRNPAEQTRLNRLAAEESVVLLKNDGDILPVSAVKQPSLAVTGTKDQVAAIRARAGSTPVFEDNSSGNGMSVIFSGDMVFVGPTPLDVKKAPAVLESQSVQGVTDVIFGDANPSGRLPVAIEPDYPFGFGLSYTTFAWSNLRIFPATPRYGQTVQVVVNVRNSGSRSGAETVELYIRQKLKAFHRVELKPGESKDVALTLDHHSMSFWDPLVHDWATEPGEFEVELGTSSRDVKLKGSFRLYR